MLLLRAYSISTFFTVKSKEVIFIQKCSPTRSFLTEMCESGAELIKPTVEQPLPLLFGTIRNYYIHNAQHHKCSCAFCKIGNLSGIQDPWRCNKMHGWYFTDRRRTKPVIVYTICLRRCLYSSICHCVMYDMS